MKKNALYLLMLICWLPLTAQNGVNSPFSQYGLMLSDLPTNMPMAYSMGGVVYTRMATNYVNPFNPASYAAIQPESFIFDISLNFTNSRMTSGEITDRDFDGSLASIAIAFPIFNWWKVSAGLLPYSNTNYQTVLTTPVTGTSQNVRTVYDGMGGISRIYLGNAFNIIGDATDYTKPMLTAGFNVNYLYGYLQQGITYDFVNSDTSYYKDTRRQKETHVNNLTFDVGILYRHPLNERYSLTAALTCNIPNTLHIDNKALVYTYTTQAAQEYLLDTIFPARGASDSYESTLEQPFSIGIGLSLERNQLWLVSADFTYATSNCMKYNEGSSHPIFGQNSLRSDATYRIAIGGGWLGNKNADSYFGRMGYTCGGYYQAGKLALDLANGSFSLDQWGIGCGITLPMRRGRSQLMLSCSYSSFGTPDALRAEYLTFGLTLSSNERWFVKRKYN
ncbi:MAG: hypothetical protein KBT04_02405 [Bacteroidales bacterium]|nr:hypothetical protein [Candidatus Colimorpha onthohippi]